MEIFLKGLSEVAQSPLAFIAYVILISGWLFNYIKNSRIRIISQNIKDIPENDRLYALKLEYNLEPKEGLSSQQFLHREKRKYFFIAFVITVIVVIIIIGLTFYKSIEIIRNDLEKKSLSIAFDTFIRSTTTSDNSNWEVTVGKLESSLAIHPSYAGYINLSDMYDELGDVKKAIWASKKAIELKPENPSPYNNLGMYYKDLGILDTADIYLTKALSLFQASKTKDDEFLTSILVNHGSVFYEKADMETDSLKKIEFARISIDKYFSKALELEGSIKDSRYLAVLLGNTGNANRILGNYETSLQQLDRSILIKKQLLHSSPQYNSIGIGIFNKGDLELKMNKIEEAKKSFAESQKYFENTGFKIGLGSVLMAQGDIYKIEGKKNLAIEHWKKARDIFQLSSLDLYVQKVDGRISQIE